MSFIQGIKNVFSTHSETRENHPDEQLKTRYYKGMRDKVFNELVTYFSRSQNFEVRSTSLERGEIIVHGKPNSKLLVVATVVMVFPNKTAIDFSVTTDTPLFTDFGKSKHAILEIYKEVGNRLEYIGSGLSKE